MLPRKSYITSLHTGSVADLWIALSICKTRGGDNGIAVHCSLSMQRFISFCEQYGHVLAAVILTNVSLFTHLRVFRMYGPHPFGYDTGFYRRYLLEPFISFPNAPVPGLGDDALVPRMLLDVLRFVHLSPDVILYGSYVAFFVAIPLLVYVLLVPTLGKRGAFIAALLIALSPIQYEAYWYMFWKNAWALCLLLGAFIAIERRWLLPLIAFDALIALSHKTTAIIYILILFIVLFIQGRRLETLMHIGITGVVLSLVAFSSIHSVASGARPVALFIDWQQFLWLVLPSLLILAAVNLKLREITLPRSVIAFCIVTLTYPLLILPFYERVFLFSDIALLILAAAAINHMLEYMQNREFSLRTWLYMGVLCISLGLFAGNFLTEIRSNVPLLPPESIEHIEEIGTLVPPDSTILTSSNEAPWFEGWTLSHITAPGMLRDTHSLPEWQALWAATSSELQIQFLADFDHPLYISTLDGFEYLIGTPSSCLTALTPYLLRDDCEH